ncbi:ATP-binding cassette domain-containing protein [Euzebya sp.]|uniref:ABC transporter ATP-binding protein n=1 Tax=Euzebya sp. TaxID=1971409 RepID=UPI003511C0E4
MAVIEVRDLVKSYDGRPVVDGVSLTVDAGEVFAIVGTNGAGKTTTVESILGLRRPDAGTIRVLGMDPQRDRAAVALRVGAQLQESRLPAKITVTEALELYASFYPDPLDGEELLADLGLTEKADGRYAQLSGGQRQRVNVALALIGNPEIAVLDELTTGLDPQARRETWWLVERIRDRGVTVVLVTHFMEEAERLADRVAVFDAGRIIATGTPTSLTTGASAEQRLRFRPSQPVDDAVLRAVDDVSDVARHGDRVEVLGTGGVIQAVLAALTRDGVVAEELRVDQPSLDDAFVALTGRPSHADQLQRSTQ